MSMTITLRQPLDFISRHTEQSVGVQR